MPRARAPRRGSRGGSGLTRRRAGEVGPREPAGRPGGAGRASPRRGDRGKMLAGPGRRRELAEVLRTLGAGRGGADLPDLAAPPPSAGRGLLTSARGFWAMSHRPGGGEGGREERASERESGRESSPPPTPAQSLRRHLLPRCAPRPARPPGTSSCGGWGAGAGRKVGCCCDSLQDPLVATEKV